MDHSGIRLRRVSQRARAERGVLSIRSIAALLRSPRAAERLFGLAVLRERVETGDLRHTYLKMARPLIGDSDNDCRWQALIVVGEYARTTPEAIWWCVRRYGASSDADLRAGVATVLLEHLFEHHPEYRAQAAKCILRGNSRLRDTFSLCWSFR